MFASMHARCMSYVILHVALTEFPMQVAPLAVLHPTRPRREELDILSFDISGATSSIMV
jgi:hypothetical protein